MKILVKYIQIDILIATINDLNKILIYFYEPALHDTNKDGRNKRENKTNIKIKTAKCRKQYETETSKGI